MSIPATTAELLAAFNSPPRSARPKWWLGSFGEAASEEEIAGVLGSMADAGFGGAVTSFDAPTPGQRNTLKSFLRAGEATGMKIDQKLGQGWPISTPNSGDQADGPHHQFELVYGVLNLAGPAPYVGPLPLPRGAPQAGPNLNPQAVSVPPKLIAVVAGKVLEEGVPVVYPAPGVLYQPYAANQPIAPTSPGISTVLDPATLTDITAQAMAGTAISYTPPDSGHWVLLAFYQRPTLEAAMDHLSTDAVTAVASYFDAEQIGAENIGRLPHGNEFFEDSLELTFSGIPWTPDMPATFKSMWGYDLVPMLPVLYIQNEYQSPGYDPAHMPNPDFDLPLGLGKRARFDFLQTLNHLYVEEHLKPFQKWAETHDGHFSSQVAYGSPFDQVRAARELATVGGSAEVEVRNAGDPVPRTSPIWHFGFDLYRATASGVHQAGKNHVASETAANNFRGLLMALSEYKGLMDKQWAAGVTNENLIIYLYGGPNEQWPGGNGRQAIVLAQSWNNRFFPEWPMWRNLTDYWARGNYLLQTGQAMADVAIYRDVATTFSSTAGAIAFDGSNSAFFPNVPVLGGPIGEDAYAVQRTSGLAHPNPFFDTQPMESEGYAIEYIDPAGLTDARAGGADVLYPNGPRYQALVVDQRSIPGATAQAIAAAVTRGLAVVIVGTPPDQGKSLANLPAEDAQVRAAFDAIVASPRTRIVATQAEAVDALEALAVRPRADFLQAVPVYTQTRRIGTNDVWYLWNAETTPATFTASFASTGLPSVMDLWSGRVERVANYTATAGRVDVPLTLRPGETMVITFDRAHPAATVPHVVATDAQAVLVRGSNIEVRDSRSGARSVTLSDGKVLSVDVPALPEPMVATDWNLHVDSSDPEMLKFDLELAELNDWRNISEIEKVSGTGSYTTTFEIPADWVSTGRGAYLDLGEFFGTIEVYLNDRRVPSPGTSDTAYSLPIPAVPRVTSRLDATPFLKAGANTLKVVLATTLQNAAKGQAEQGYANSASSALGPTQPYGLIGPVSLQAFGSKQFQVSGLTPTGAIGSVPGAVEPTVIANAPTPTSSSVVDAGGRFGGGSFGVVPALFIGLGCLARGFSRRVRRHAAQHRATN